MISQTSVPLLEKVFNRILLFALLVIEMMPPRVNDRREYLCEGTLVNYSVIALTSQSLIKEIKVNVMNAVFSL